MALLAILRRRKLYLVICEETGPFRGFVDFSLFLFKA